MDRTGIEPVWGPTKTKKARTIVLTEETLTALEAHRKAQLEVYLRNRTTYQSFGLMFAKEGG